MKVISLARLPLILSVTIGSLFILIIVLLYGLVVSELTDERALRMQNQAQHLAEQIKANLALQSSTLKRLSALDELVDRVQMPNSTQRQALEDRLQLYFPDAWKLRLISVGFQNTEPDQTPPIKYSDLDLIRRSEVDGKAPPALAHGIGTPSARVALVQPVFKRAAPESESPGSSLATNQPSESVVGHMVLTFPAAMLTELVAQLDAGDGYMELQQARQQGEPQVLAANGDQSARAEDTLRLFPIAGSRWQLAYWPSPSLRVAGGVVSIAFGTAAGILVLIATGLLFVTCRAANGAIRTDLATLVTMVRQAQSGKLKSDYPVASVEVFGTIHTVCEELFSWRSKMTLEESRSGPSLLNDTPDIDLDLELD